MFSFHNENMFMQKSQTTTKNLFFTYTWASVITKVTMEIALSTYGFGILWICYHVHVFLQNNNHNKITITPVPRDTTFHVSGWQIFQCFLVTNVSEENRHFICCWWDCKSLKNLSGEHFGNIHWIFKKHTPFNPEIPLLGIYPMSRFPQIFPYRQKWQFIGGLFVIIKQSNKQKPYKTTT